MYPRLGVVELSVADTGDVSNDDGTDINGDPTFTTPTVVTTEVTSPDASTPPVPFQIAPVSVAPTVQTLPTLVANVPGPNGWEVAGILVAVWALSRGRGRGTQSWV